MKPSLGWTLLSRDALRRAETQLRDEIQGVRDEIGFLALHQGYADRFFPGTSVLHTRLRYVLFVPWLYQNLMGRSERRQIAAALEASEITLAGRLKKANEDGIIGGLTYPKPTTQPASLVYWTALGTWRILRPNADGAYRSRSAVHRTIARRSPVLRLQDDDKQLLEEPDSIFVTLPAPPDNWHDQDAAIDFRLKPSESTFVRGVLLAVPHPRDQNRPSFLSRLVETGRLTSNSAMWSKAVVDVADDDDRVALIRSRRAAALSAIGRAIYAALVEEMRDTADRIPTPDIHRSNLKAVIDEYAHDALQLAIPEIRTDVPGINEEVLQVLHETQQWVRGDRRAFSELHAIYERAETRRKGRRARLMRTLAAREKRLEWMANEHPLAKPIHYRWYHVRRLLMDLKRDT